jgi:hypothetical protein
MGGHRLASIVFIAGAIGSAAWALHNLWPLKDLFGFGDFGGGGIGGLTTGVDALISIAAPLVAFAISRGVRAHEGRAHRLRTAHMAVTATIIMLVAAFILVTVLGNFTHGIDGLWSVLVVAAFVGGALWLPVHSFFAAGFLGLLIEERRPAS